MTFVNIEMQEAKMYKCVIQDKRECLTDVYIKIEKTDDVFDNVMFKQNEHEDYLVYKVGYGDKTEKYFLEEGNIESNLLFDVEEYKKQQIIKEIILELFTKSREEPYIVSMFYNMGQVEIIHRDMSKRHQKIEVEDGPEELAREFSQKVELGDGYKDMKQYESTYKPYDTVMFNGEDRYVARGVKNGMKMPHVLLMEESDVGGFKKYLEKYGTYILYVVAPTTSMNYVKRCKILSLCKEYNVKVVVGICRVRQYTFGDVGPMNTSFLTPGPVSIISCSQFFPNVKLKCVREYAKLDPKLPQFQYHVKKACSDMYTKLIVIDHDLESYGNFRSEFQTQELTEIARLISTNVVKKPVIVKTSFLNIGEMFETSGAIVVYNKFALEEVLDKFMNILYKTDVAFVDSTKQAMEDEEFVEAFNKYVKL